MLKETNFGSRPDGLAEQFGQSFSLTVVPLMIRNLIDTLSPTQCVSSYYRIRFEGEKLLDTLDWKPQRKIETPIAEAATNPESNTSYTERTSVALTPEDLAALEQLAKDTGVSVEQLVKELEEAPAGEAVQVR